MTTKERPNSSEAWILGSGTASLASALYLVRLANYPPQKVHVLDSHGSLGDAMHHRGDPSSGYDQFAGCLPVPVGEPLKQLLALVPSVRNENRSVFDEIQNSQAKSKKGNGIEHTQFLVQRDGVLRSIPTKSLNLSIRQRLALARLILKREKSLHRTQINDYLPRSFFQSTFWAIWSAQFGFQPWHSASEFRRTIRQYLQEFHGLTILSCLDITGRFQFESTFLPIYHFLRSLQVDFRFDSKVKEIGTAIRNGGGNGDGKRKGGAPTVTWLDLVEKGLDVRQPIGPDDIVLFALGSTVSGSATGTDDRAPFRKSMQASEALDENWSLWLELAGKHPCFGDPYNFCTRQCESMLESFTVTTEDVEVYEQLCALSGNSAQAGAFIALQESPWRMNLCLPTQPVFAEQPRNVRVFWGFANFPMSEGKYVAKAMVRCSGAEIMHELVKHLKLDEQHLVRRTVTVPRVMPRMSAILLPRAVGDRPGIVPEGVSNVGLVGQFCEIPQHSCVDMSYSVRTAQRAVSQLTGLGIEQQSALGGLNLSTVVKVLCWR
ncbi:oleate hydratase [Aspergillus aurantiobrunneus]